MDEFNFAIADRHIALRDYLNNRGHMMGNDANMNNDAIHQMLMSMQRRNPRGYGMMHGASSEDARVNNMTEAQFAAYFNELHMRDA